MISLYLGRKVAVSVSFLGACIRVWGHRKRPGLCHRRAAAKINRKTLIFIFCKYLFFVNYECKMDFSELDNFAKRIEIGRLEIVYSIEG